MMSKQSVKCLFGFHNYSIPSKEDPRILICENCKRFGYWKSLTGIEYWCEYDEKGNLIHCRDSNGFEMWRNGSKWVDEKLENWIYETFFKRVGRFTRTTVKGLWKKSTQLTL